MTTFAAHAWPTNAELIAAVASLHLDRSMVALDPTYEKGIWWRKWRPDRLITHNRAVVTLTTTTGECTIRRTHQTEVTDLNELTIPLDERRVPLSVRVSSTAKLAIARAARQADVTPSALVGTLLDAAFASGGDR